MDQRCKQQHSSLAKRESRPISRAEKLTSNHQSAPQQLCESALDDPQVQPGATEVTTNHKPSPTLRKEDARSVPDTILHDGGGDGGGVCVAEGSMHSALQQELEGWQRLADLRQQHAELQQRHTDLQQQHLAVESAVALLLQQQERLERANQSLGVESGREIGRAMQEMRSLCDQVGKYLHFLFV